MKILRTIDQIAVEKQRDICFVVFSNHGGDWHHPVPYWTSNEHPRHIITDWLIANNIEWEDCFELQIPEGHEVYHGHFYIDIVVNDKDPKYQALVSFLEDEHGKVKPVFGEDTRFCILPFSVVLPHKGHKK